MQPRTSEEVSQVNGSSTSGDSPPTVLDRNRQTAEVLYRSASLVVGDVHCPLFHRACGPVEHADGPVILLVRTGLFTKTTGRYTVVADPNHVLFFTRHEPYRITHPVPGGDTCTSLSLRTKDLLEIVGNYAPRDAERDDVAFPFVSALSSARAFLLHHTLLAELRRGRIAPLAVEDLVFDLVDDLVGQAYEVCRGRRSRRYADAPEVRRSLVEAAKLAIEERLQRPPSLGEIAEALGCSTFHLSRTFHRESGLPVRRYLDRSRLRTALERLAEGETDLTGLALDLGYADHSHFTNAFRREFGMPPSRFRQRATGAIVRKARKNLQA